MSFTKPPLFKYDLAVACVVGNIQNIVSYTLRKDNIAQFILWLFRDKVYAGLFPFRLLCFWLICARF